MQYHYYFQTVYLFFNIYFTFKNFDKYIYFCEYLDSKLHKKQIYKLWILYVFNIKLRK